MRSDGPPAPTETQKRLSNDLPDAYYKQEATISWRDRKGELQTQTISGPTTLGSAPGTALRIADDPLISRIHAEFDPQREGVWIRDLGSRNGTFYEGGLVGKIRVPDGARITVGRTEFLVRLADSKNETSLYPTLAYGPLLGRSPEMRAMFLKLERMSGTDSTVLIQGETGTGKELVAQVIHEKSARAAGPFITVDCGALPEEMLDAELFGHVRGSFTGAVSDREGAFEAADGGTIFLDEIGELPLALQPRLLRAIEMRMVRRIGENTRRKIDVRFVAATHRDLREMVNAGTFREDLYFRLAVLPIEVPPLRDRPDDIPLLYLHFLAEAMRAMRCSRRGSASTCMGLPSVTLARRATWWRNRRSFRATRGNSCEQSGREK